MNKELKLKVKNRQTQLQMAFDMATEGRQEALNKIDRMYEKVKGLRIVISDMEDRIELCKQRAIEQGVLYIL